MDQPLTESIHLNLQDPEHVIISSYKMTGDSIMLPFVEDPDNARLVAILYMTESESDEHDLRICHPFAIGVQNIMSTEGENHDILALNWVEFEPSCSLQEHVLPPDSGKTFKPMTLDIRFKVAITAMGEPGRTCRLTAVDPMFPSPLFTVSGLRLKLPKIIPKGASVFMGCSLRKLSLDPKNPESKLIISAMRPSSSEPVEVGYTSSVPFTEDQVCFLEPLNFMLDSSIRENVSLQLDVFFWERKRAKKVATFTVNVTKAFEMHVVNIETKTSLLSRENANLRLNTIFPVVVAVPAKLRASLLDISKDPDPQERMYPSLVPYIVQQRISPSQLPSVDFSKLYELFVTADQTFQVWIEHYFTPEPGFAIAFLNKVVDNLDAIKALSMPFFMLIFKAMLVDQNFDFEALGRLFKAVSKTTFPTVHKSASDLLIQLLLTCDTKMVHRITYSFLDDLSVKDRLVVYNFLFSDMPFLRSVALFDPPTVNRPMSPFSPLLSMFYKSVNSAFMENGAETLRKLARTLSLLASTLEQFADSENAQKMARALFPLIPLIFTFYDSLAAALITDQLNEVHILTPILLFLLKNTANQRFLLYYDMLSYDNQLRFFEFLITLSEEGMIRSVAGACTTFPALNTTYEIVCRITTFITFLSRKDVEKASTLEHLFKLLAQMLDQSSSGRVF
jgi:hypothetical protein